VTQTSPTEATDGTSPMFPPGRYGRRRERPGRPRWMLPVLLVVGVVILGAIVTKLYFQYGNDEFSATVIKQSNITDSSITVTFDVVKRGDAPGTCTLQAFTYHNAQVGEAQVDVAKGENVRVTYTLPTTAKAYMAEIPACQPRQ